MMLKLKLKYESSDMDSGKGDINIHSVCGSKDVDMMEEDKAEYTLVP